MIPFFMHFLFFFLFQLFQHFLDPFFYTVFTIASYLHIFCSILFILLHHISIFLDPSLFYCFNECNILVILYSSFVLYSSCFARYFYVMYVCFFIAPRIPGYLHTQWMGCFSIVFHYCQIFALSLGLLFTLYCFNFY